MGVTSGLAQFIVESSYEQLPQEVVKLSKDMIINAIGVGLAGSRTKEAEIVRELVRDMGGHTQCTLLGADFMSSMTNAALVNGTSVHALDYDEVVLRRANHPSNVMLPAVMAVAERLGSSGRDFVSAFAIGCEVSTKLGAAGDLDSLIPTLNRNGWHIESVAGALGAAAASAKLLRMDRARVEMALGIAVSQACGVQANYGTSTKSFHCGLAAMHGIMAAKLADKGFSSAEGAVEDNHGFFGCFRRDTDVEADFTSRLGKPFDVVDPGVGLKLYPCGSALHTAIDVTLGLVKRFKLDAANIDHVGVSWPPRAGNKLSSFAHPRNGLEAKFSMQYCVAVSLVDGPPRLYHFTDEAVHNDEIVKLLDKITVSYDEVPTLAAPRPCTVSISMINGETVTERGVYASGHPGHPLTEGQLAEKFRDCAAGVMAAEAASATFQLLKDLELVADVRPLLGGLGATPGRGSEALADR